MSGFVVALGVLLLMGALGLAIGVTALGDPRAATSATASGLGIGGGVWAFITLVAVIYLSAYIDEITAARAGHHPAGFLPKPVSDRDLQRTLNRILGPQE